MKFFPVSHLAHFLHPRSRYELRKYDLVLVAKSRYYRKKREIAEKMSQGKRKVPFSGKAKKQQMQAKKNRQFRAILVGKEDDEDYKDAEDAASGRNIQKINQSQNDSSGRSRYALQFFQESRKELEKRREEARKRIEPVPLERQEVSDDYFPSEIDMPKRPPWDFSMSKEQLDAREQKYFSNYLKKIEDSRTASYFELNLETWRQIWRVLEMSDVLLVIVDVRYPALMFPPYLYDHVTKDLRKDMILIINKIDLSPPSLVVAWSEYFKSRYPKLRILYFTSFPAYNLRGNPTINENIKARRRKGKLRMAAEGAQKLLEACREIVGDRVDLASWRDKIEEEIHLEYDLDDLDRKDNVVVEKQDTSFFKHERYKNGILTIGCIGTPNVGKSSLMNALMGKKVVSVSRTPGHTKHFQTIYLTKNVRLCDCPGLVFPSTVPKQLQIIMGSFPIAQVREPYTTVKFIAERLDLPKLLRIQHQDNDEEWSAMDICDGWAAKRNYITARAGRHDTYRAANSLLRMVLEGKICVYVYPPGWAEKKDEWSKHPDVETIKWIQASCAEDDRTKETIYSSSSEEEEDGDGEAKSMERDGEDDDEDESNVPVVVNKFQALSTDA